MNFKDISNTFRNKRILITGNTGFKGSWLTTWLLSFNSKVYGYSKNIPTNPSMYKKLNLDKHIYHTYGDVEDIKKFKSTIFRVKPHFIFHLAAQSLVSNSYKDPLSTWKTNSLGIINLLESLRLYKRRINVIIITSDKSYKNLELNRGYSENDILGGKDPYSASKASAENAIYSYVHSFFQNNSKIRIATARAGNVIGGGDWSKDRLIPDCIKNCIKKKVTKIRNPFSTRPWQHVLEALSGYLFLAYYLKNNRKIHGEVFNFGPSKKSNYSVINLLKIIALRLPNFKWKIEKKNELFFESKLLKLNSTKAYKILGWKSALNINQIINFLCEWYLSYYEKKNMLNFTKYQITKFEKLIKFY